MGKTLTNIVFGVGTLAGILIAFNGVEKEDAWKYYLAGAATTFVTTTAAVVLGSREKYKSEDDSDYNQRK